jgi:hypothetical protein
MMEMNEQYDNLIALISLPNGDIIVVDSGRPAINIYDRLIQLWDDNNDGISSYSSDSVQSDDDPPNDSSDIDTDVDNEGILQIDNPFYGSHVDDERVVLLTHLQLNHAVTYHQGTYLLVTSGCWVAPSTSSTAHICVPDFMLQQVRCMHQHLVKYFGGNSIVC